VASDGSRLSVVVLGDFRHEGLTAKIDSLGFEVVSKQFRSGLKNWIAISDSLAELRAKDQRAAVLAYVPTPSLLLIAGSKY
jgi:hypothetical protein